MRIVFPLAFALLCVHCVRAVDVRVGTSGSGGSNAKVFEPTDEWQTVAEDEVLPQGLHVRMNLQTHTVEAKLMDSDNDEMNEKSLVHVAGDQTDNSKSNRETLNDSDKLSLSDESNIKDLLKDIKKQKNPAKFRTYEEIKKTLSAQNFAIKTEMELLSTVHKRLEKYVVLTNEDSTVTSEEHHEKTLNDLEDLELYLHQIDNGVQFVKMNGVETLLTMVGSERVPFSVKEVALRCLGAMFQGNPEAKVLAYNFSIVQAMMEFITSFTNAKYDLSTNKTVLTLIKRAVFVLSSYLRQFPVAQTQFFHSATDEIADGVRVLRNLCDLVRHDENYLAVFEKVNRLMKDLLSEFVETMHHEPESEKMNQYMEADVANALRVAGWCQVLTSNENDTLVTTGDVLDLCEDCRHVYNALACVTLQNTGDGRGVEHKPKLRVKRDSFEDDFDLNVNGEKITYDYDDEDTYLEEKDEL